ncbi:MAG: phosphotyrosine protein phosphatase [Gammaproteobacteria bacterium]
MKAWIDRRFGTWRGLVRSLLAHAELYTGRLAPFTLRHPERVRRVVYVCLGNICRSAYGHHVAVEAGLNVASLGLSTTTGVGSPAQAVQAASRNGVDMRAHRARDYKDFEVRPGDLFLVMEVRQAHELRRRLGARDDVQICLLGLWCKPAMPHLHDPFTLSDPYFDTCFARVRAATLNLARVLPNARASAPASQASPSHP